MSSIPPRFMQELRDRLTLSEVIGRRVKLGRAGREFRACCPFHHEKSPSFYVNDDKQFYHCFGCGAHGDVIGFVMRHDNLSFVEAIESLAVQAGMDVPKQTPQEIEQAKREKDLYTLMEDVAKFFEAKLQDPAHRDALKYLNDRGVNDEQIASYRIGFSPADGKLLPAYLKNQGYTDAQMAEVGVARISNRDGQAFSFFRDRVMFPVPDKRGRIVAFGGRVLPEHLRPLMPGQSKPPKYINSPDSPLFHKGRMLYGEPHARQAAKGDQPLIVVEGYLDVIASAGAGYKGSVAPLGTALTEDQIMVLWKMIPGDQKVPILCFDGDDAGRRAAARACDRIMPLLKANHSVRMAFLPDGQDPDSLIRAQGKAAFDSVITSAMPLIDFIWMFNTSGQRFETPEERAGLSSNLENISLRIQDRSVQHFYREAFRQRVRDTFGRDSKSGIPGQGGSDKKRSSAGKKPQGGLVPAVLRRPAFSGDRTPAMILLACLINHPGLFGWVEDQIGRVDMPDVRLAGLRSQIIQNLMEGPDVDSETMVSMLKAVGYGPELDILLSEAIYTHAGFARPKTELEFVRKGWQETMALMHRKTVMRELKEAGQILATEFSDENEQRILALHRSSRLSET